MFYSQTFLARKGPLGTVWCAAHLQNRLRKSHYTSTDIVSTVERIMFPEVPIALRMSGHLLLGVVRIYSMKVEYLVKDCEAVKVRLLKAFATVDINLPENAATARPEAVTLPPVLELDAVDLDDGHLTPEGSPDTHLRSHEDITLPDQIPPSGGRDPYIAITFDDDDVMLDKILQEQDDHANIRPMDEDIDPGDNLNADVGLRETGTSLEREAIRVGDPCDPGTSNQTQVVTQPMDEQDHGGSDRTEVLADTQELPDSGPSDRTVLVDSMFLGDDSLPEIEVLRDAVHEMELRNLPPLMQQDQTSEASELSRPGETVIIDKDIVSPIAEENSPINGQPTPSNQHLKQPNSVASEEAADLFDIHASFGNTSPGFALRSSPSDQEIRIQPSLPPQPPKRGRKRKIFFDESPVIKNKFMKKQLDNTSDLLRKKRAAPSSALGVWKVRNKLRKEQVLFETSLTGLSGDICNLFKNGFIPAKPHLSLAREATPDNMVGTSSDSPNEHIRDTGDTSSPTSVPDVMRETGVVTPAPVPKVVQEARVGASPAPAFKTTAGPAVTPTQVVNAESYAEIERLRNVGSPAGMAFLSGLLPSPPRMASSRNASPSRTDNFTPAFTDLGLETTGHTRTTIGTEALSTPDLAASTRTFNTESGTAGMSLDDRFDIDHRLSDIPEMMNDMDAEDLYFLEAESTAPGSQGSQRVDALSVRTRAVAQYLRKNSPGAAMADGSFDSLSLTQILEGRKRKICARMFYEVLVLKSYGLIDVEQDQPYGDIKLKLIPTISKI